MTVAATATGVVFASAGAGVSALWSDATVPLAVALGAAALAYALHELGFVRLPVPGRSWQVPVEWLRGGFYRTAVIFGSIVGFGVFTRVTFAVLPILLAWLFVSGNILYGALAGLVYGAVRAISIYSSATSRTPEEVTQVSQRIMALAAPAHQATGLLLAAFATYLFVAPYLP